MTKEEKSQTVVIRYKKGGPSRFLERARVHVAAENPAAEEWIARPAVDTSMDGATNVSSVDLTSTASNSEKLPDVLPGVVATAKAVSKPPSTLEEQSVPLPLQMEEAACLDGPSEDKTTVKNSDPETLEAFIAYAYSRKGQKVRLKHNVIKKLSRRAKLDAAAIARLHVLAEQDRTLSVPRQLLLAARSIEGFPMLPRTIVDFVQEVMGRHAIYQSTVLADAIQISNHSGSLCSALQSIQNFRWPKILVPTECTDAELANLKSNASNLFVTWMFQVRHIRLDDLVAALLQVVWLPAARELDNDTERIRALTEVSETALLGWIVDRFRRTTEEAQAERQRALDNVVSAKSELSRIHTELAVSQAISDALEAEFQQTKQSAEAQATELLNARTVERAQLTHKLEQLRGRLIERLDECLGLLNTGLSALQRDQPKVEVMVQRAETVIERLSDEKNRLQEG